MDLICAAVGRRYYIGSIWLAIKRQQQGRVAGIKILARLIPAAQAGQAKGASEVQPPTQEQRTGSEATEESSRSIPGDRLSAGMQDCVRSDKKLSVDLDGPGLESQFLESAQVSSPDLQIELKQLCDKINDNCESNNFPNRSSFILSVICTVIEEPNVLAQRLMLDFLLSHLPITGSRLTQSDKLVLTEALLRQLSAQELSLTRRVYSWFFGSPDLSNRYSVSEDAPFVLPMITQAFKNLLSKPPSAFPAPCLAIKVIQLFFADHTHMIEHVMKDLATPIIKFLREYSQGHAFSADILGLGQKLLLTAARSIDQMLDNLSEQMIKHIKQRNDKQCLELVGLIEFAFNRLIDEKEYANPNSAQNCLRSSLANIFKQMGALAAEDIKQLYFIGPALSLIITQLKKLKVIRDKTLKQQKNLTIENNQVELPVMNQDELKQYNIDAQIVSFGAFYEQLCLVILEESSAESSGLCLGLGGGGAPAKTQFDAIYSQASLILIVIQKMRIDKEVKELPAWFKRLFEVQNVRHAALSLTAIYTYVKIMKCDYKDSVYGHLKALVLSLPAAVSRDAPQNFVNAALQKLWSLLDFQHFQTKIINMIVYISIVFPEHFAAHISGSLSAEQISDKELSIRRFAVLWNHSHIMLAKFRLSTINTVGLLMMLAFLDHENPLIRHASKNWLLASKNQLQRVVDPLFHALLSSRDCCATTSPDQQAPQLLLFTRVYETRQTNDAFRHLKNILLNAPELFLSFLKSNAPSQSILDLKTPYTDKKKSFLFAPLPQTWILLNTGSSQPTSVQPQVEGQQRLSQKPAQGTAAEEEEKEVLEDVDAQSGHPFTYMDLLVSLCMLYIQAEVAEEIKSTKFCIESSAVRASACEFLQLVAAHISSRTVLLNLYGFTLEPLLLVLQQAIASGNHVMQLQLLHMLDQTLLHSQFAEKGNTRLKARVLAPVLASKLFIPTLVRGISSELSYVRQQYIQFISATIPLLGRYLVHPQLTNTVKSLIFSYQSLIKDILKRKSVLDLSSQPDRSPTSAEQGRALLQVLACDTVSQNDFRDEEMNYETYLLLEGIYQILHYFLKLKSQQDLDSIQNTINQSAIQSIATVLTLGIFVPDAKASESAKYQFEKHQETCECLLYDLKQVVEVFTSCWQVTDSFKDYIVSSHSCFGALPFRPDSFAHLNRILNQLIIDMDIQMHNQKGNPRAVISKVLKALFLQFPRETISTVLQIWFRMCPSAPPGALAEFKLKLAQIRLLEMLVVLNIKVDFLLQAVYESSYMEKLQQLMQKKSGAGGKDKKVQLSYEAAVIESKLLFFLYSLTSLYYVEESAAQRAQRLGSFWQQATKLLQLFGASRNPSTAVWLLDLLHMLSQKYALAESLPEFKLRKELQELVSEKLAYCLQVATKGVSLAFNDQLSSQQPKEQMQALAQYKLIVPFSPQFYGVVLKHYEEAARESCAGQRRGEADTLSDIAQTLFGDVCASNEEELYAKYRLVVLLSLKGSVCELVPNCLMAEKPEKGMQMYRIVLAPLFQLFDNKQLSNQVYYEAGLLLLCAVFASAPEVFIKEFKKSLLEIFNQDDFFSSNKQILRVWSRLVKWMEDDQQIDLFQEYVSRLTLTTSFFSKEQNENKKRIKSFYRICFIIYAGSKDYYAKQLPQLIDKISEVIKTPETAHPSLLVLILFCVRILVLRLSARNLEDLFAKTWPMLLTLLLQIFTPIRQNQRLEHKTMSLILAALKLVELLSVARIDQFYLHQWMFIIDYFGLKIESRRGDDQGMDSALDSQTADGATRDRTAATPFLFQPCIANCLPAKEFRFSYLNAESTTAPQTAPHEQKPRKLIMVQSKFEDEQQLRIQALYLCQYIISSNEQNDRLEESQIESLIEDEFLAMDEFILKL